jgi:hypothetical protein
MEYIERARLVVIAYLGFDFAWFMLNSYVRASALTHDS